jgi:hypothetical protein
MKWLKMPDYRIWLNHFAQAPAVHGAAWTGIFVYDGLDKRMIFDILKS